MSHTEYYTFDDAHHLVVDAVAYIIGEHSNVDVGDLKIHIRLDNAHEVYISIDNDIIYVSLSHIAGRIQLDEDNMAATTQVMYILEQYGRGIQYINIEHNATSFFVLPPIHRQRPLGRSSSRDGGR